MSQTTRRNHFVPQAYLRHWSVDSNNISAYRILVSNDRVPLWSSKPIRSIAYHEDLYTQFKNNQEVDDFELWLKTDFEDPGYEVINKIVDQKSLTSLDWERLTLFMAAQDLRTPTSFLEYKVLCETMLPDLMKASMENSLAEMENAIEQGLSFREEMPSNYLSDRFKISIKEADQSESGKPEVHAEIIVGRGLWIASMKQLLTGGAVKILGTHKWSILLPDPSMEWITSDHPVLKLNYYAPGKYDFSGGWNKTGTELMLPLSPTQLLYTKVGTENYPEYCTVSKEQTLSIQMLLAERARRWIFARQPIDIIGRFRPRLVDLVMVKNEEEAWKKWHEEHREMEGERTS